MKPTKSTSAGLARAHSTMSGTPARFRALDDGDEGQMGLRALAGHSGQLGADDVEVPFREVLPAGLERIDPDDDASQPGPLEPGHALRSEAQGARLQPGAEPAPGDIADDLVEVRMQERLAAAEGDDLAVPQPDDLVDVRPDRLHRLMGLGDVVAVAAPVAAGAAHPAMGRDLHPAVGIVVLGERQPVEGPDVGDGGGGHRGSFPGFAGARRARR